MTIGRLAAQYAWADIESNEGVITVRVTRRVQAPELALLEELCQSLPPAIRLLRVQLPRVDAKQGVLERIGRALREWRQLRSSALHFLLSPVQKARSLDVAYRPVDREAPPVVPSTRQPGYAFGDEAAFTAAFL